MLFCLLLALAGALLCISSGLWFSANNALRNLNDTITTIAIPDPFYIERFAESRGIAEEDIQHTIRNSVYSSGLLQMDDRRIFNAYAEGINPVPMRVSGFGLEPRIAAYSSRSVAAFIVTCEKLDAKYDYTTVWDEESGVPETYVQKQDYASFSVDEALYLHPDYPVPRYLNIVFHTSKSDFAPFELRKQYVVMGKFTPGGGFMSGFSSLTVDAPGVDLVEAVIGYINTEEEFLSIFPRWTWVTENFPIEIKAYVYDREPQAADGEYSYFELTGSIEDAMASGERLWMKEALDNAEISSRSFQVMTTNDALSMFRLNQRRNLFEEGRTISAREARDGARVCLISRNFAEHNELSVGDVLPLELYAAVYGTETISYNPSEDARLITQSIWVPSMYHKGLEITEPIEYTVIGIMNITASDFSDYAISNNLVIIPDKSFEGAAGEPVSQLPVAEFVPLLNDSIIVRNGFVDETRAVIDGIAEGYGSLFRVYDQGYGSVRTALGNLHFGMSWILALTVAVWIAIAYLYSFFFTGRKRVEAGVLNSIGINKTSRFFWVFIQGMIPVLLSLGISLAAALPLYEYVIEAAADITEAFTDSFRDLTLSDAADSGIRQRIPLDSSPVSMVLSAITGTVILLAVTGLMSARSVMFRTLSAGKGEN